MDLAQTCLLSTEKVLIHCSESMQGLGYLDPVTIWEAEAFSIWILIAFFFHKSSIISCHMWTSSMPNSRRTQILSTSSISSILSSSCSRTYKRSGSSSISVYYLICMGGIQFNSKTGGIPNFLPNWGIFFIFYYYIFLHS